MNIDKYLERIAYKGSRVISKETLFALHSAHLFQVPFENLDIFHNKYIPYDVDYFYEKVVKKGRGGFCYELNSLFEKLLRDLGFQTSFISARLVNNDGTLGPEYDHMAILVEVDNQKYLCDVGFGDSFIAPMPVIMNVEQDQQGKIYTITETAWGAYALNQLLPGGRVVGMYCFSLESKAWDDFYPQFIEHQVQPASKFRQKRICSLPTPAGRITIGNLKLIVTQNIQKTIVHLKSEEEFLENLRQYFNIHFSAPAIAGK